MTDLRERVAWTLAYEEWPHATDVDRQAYANRKWTWFFQKADAVLSIARPAIIEECAEFVTQFDDGVMSEDIARLMRKMLPEKP